jgi:hypothetical protein
MILQYQVQILFLADSFLKKYLFTLKYLYFGLIFN